jgi:hypothetical protein
MKDSSVIKVGERERERERERENVETVSVIMFSVY